MDPITLSLLAAGGSAIGSGLSGYFGAESEAEQNQAILDAINSGSAEAETMMRELAAQRGQTVEQLYGGLTQGFQDTSANYMDALQGTDFNQFNVQAPEDFQFDLQAETQAMLNPELNAILDAQTQQLEGSAANRGSLFSGETGRAIADSTAATTAQEFGSARNAAMAQQGQKYSQFTNKWQQQLQAAQQNSGNAMQNLANMGTGYNAQAGQYGQMANQSLAGQDALSQALAGLKGQQLQATAAAAGNSGGSAAGSMFGALPGAINTGLDFYKALK